jgi:hypothetical protein
MSAAAKPSLALVTTQIPSVSSHRLRDYPADELLVMGRNDALPSASYDPFQSAILEGLQILS